MGREKGEKGEGTECARKNVLNMQYIHLQKLFFLSFSVPPSLPPFSLPSPFSPSLFLHSRS